MSRKDYSKYSKEELIKVVKQLEKTNFGLVWEDKPENVALQCDKEFPVLKEEKDSDVIKNKVLPYNILIEGDNYHSLWALNYTHKKAIDVIYIDPPYNRGDNDFKYNDNYVDKEDSFRHSMWLSFMHKRLQLAKKLLKDTGVIFISIDDTEYAPLKLLCDKVFGKDSFKATIVWEKKYSPANDSKYLSDTHDYVLVYSKSNWKVNLFKRTEEMDARYSNPDNDPRLDWKPGGFSVKSYTKEYDYPITLPSGRIVNPPSGSCWQTSPDNYKLLLEDNRIWFGVDGNAKPQIKQFLSEVQQGLVPKTLWFKEESGHNQLAMNLLKEIIGPKAQKFGTPKPIQLIKRILSIATDKSDAIVLDFFAGTGTTGHAVIEYNTEENKNLRFILCTNNENDICREVTYERLYKVINGYKFKGKSKNAVFTKKLTASDIINPSNIHASILKIIEKNKEKYDKFEKEIKKDNFIIYGVNNVISEKKGIDANLKYYKTDFVPIIKTDNDKRKLVERSTEMLCLAESTFEKIIFKYNKFGLFENLNFVTGILYDEDYLDEFKLNLKKHSKPFIIYVFSYDQYYNEEDFLDLKGIVKVKPIPEAILNVYRNINKRKNK